MGKLTLGEISVDTPKGVVFKWGAPANGGGFIWMHTKQMTNEDFMFFRDWISNPHAIGGMPAKEVPVEEFDADPWRFIQKSTIVGTHHPKYTTHFVESAGSDKLKKRRKRSSGGIGSSVYENQWLPSGVKMPQPKYRVGGSRHKSGFWFMNKEGELVKSIPSENSGAYWTDKHGVNHEGPKPGSRAEKMLQDHSISWNEKNQWWDVKPQWTKVSPVRR
jgi:hypothetical protein